MRAPAFAEFDEVPQPGFSARAKEKPRRRWGQRGAFNGRFALEGLSPGLRTERRRPRWHAEEKNGACPVTKHRKEADSVRVWRWYHSSVQFSL